MRLFDSHAHYDDARFEGQTEEILAAVHAFGVRTIVNIGASLASSQTSVSLAEAHDYMYAAVGVHPSDAVNDRKDPTWLEQIEALYSHPKVLAIGEIGLDYHYGKDDIEEQKQCFEAQMALADRLHAPVVIHDREAHEDTLAILAKFPSVTAVIHSFSGSAEMAKEILRRGHYLSVGGVLTFSNARKLVEVVEQLDMLHPEARSRLLLETDCPYLAPVPYRGKLNRSDYMLETAKKAADLLHISTEELCEMTWRNACRFYGLPYEAQEKPL